jgi:vancomycin resistance protein YoaR
MPDSDKSKDKEKTEKETKESSAEGKKRIEGNLRAALIWSLTAAGVFVVLAAFGAFTVFGYARLYENRIFPGMRALGVRLDGLTADEARTALNRAIDEALKDGLRFRLDGRDVTLGAATVATNDPGASRDLIRYDIEESVAAALSYGRSGPVLRDTLLRWKARVRPVHLHANVFIDEKEIREGINKALEDRIGGAEDASLEIRWNSASGRAETSVSESKDGEEIRFEIALAELRAQSEILRFEPIELQRSPAHPSITGGDIELLLDDIPEWMDYAPFTLTYDGREYAVSKDLFASWLGAVMKDGEVALSIDPGRFHDGIRELTDIEQTASKGSLVIENGRIVSFQAGTTGYAIEDQATLDSILPNLGSSTAFEITVKKEEASLTGDDPERLGIKEIIGIGRSNFAGSPTNRRKNIALGVEKVNGSIIAPGEEFSLLRTLGPVTAANGWLSELVIKGNKTVPEYGGGLCQIGTTTFRAAVQSGMKITERRNHSYRVSYYEPAGTDATIYEPSPDFKFINDTAHYVLIHAYISGTEVIYEFWGTEDGRKIIVGQPRIYNITPAPPVKLIETTDLEPGKKKCTESAHAGADTAFDYRIEYADGSVHEETFYSHYRPWQAVCLIGVEELTEESEAPEEDGAAAETSTDAEAPAAPVTP